MAKKIFKGIFGGGKKKAAEPVAPAEKKGPIITQLGDTPASPLDPRRRRAKRPAFGSDPTILADKLGSY